MLQRKDCRLRPLKEEDLSIVLNWRNSDRIREMMFTDHIISLAEHKKWFASIQQNQSRSQHLLFEYQGELLGQVNITQIDHVNHRCYWGFFIGKDNAPSGSGMAMGFLTLEYVFERLTLHKLCSEVFIYNIVSRNYQQKLGFIQEGIFKEHIMKRDKLEDIVCLAYFSSLWRKEKDKLFKQCFGGNSNYE